MKFWQLAIVFCVLVAVLSEASADKEKQIGPGNDGTAPLESANPNQHVRSKRHFMRRWGRWGRWGMGRDRCYKDCEDDGDCPLYCDCVFHPYFQGCEPGTSG